MPSCFPRPAGFALVLLVAASALPAQAQVVIEERVTPVPLAVTVPGAANSVAAPSTFTPTVSGTLRLRYESLNEGQYWTRFSGYVDLTTAGLEVTFDGSRDTDPLFGRFAFRRRMVGSFGFRGYYYDTYFAQERPRWRTTYSLRTEGIDEYEAEPTWDLGAVVAGTPIALGADYLDPEGGRHPLTLTETAGTDTSFVVRGRYYAGGSPIGTPSRQITVVFDVVPPEPEIRLLRQDDTPLDSLAASSALCDCAMVSRMPTDLLFPDPVAFASPFKGATNPHVDYDPDTVRPEIVGLRDSAQVSFVVDVFRGGDRVALYVDGRESGPTMATATYPSVGEMRVDSLSGDTTYTYRSTQFVRFVSNAEPAVGALSGGKPFEKYDDEVGGLRTLRVELGDVVRTRAVVDGDTLSQKALNDIGQTAGATGFYDQRSVLLAWHTYAPLPADPAVVTSRMSEDFAQAAISFSRASADTYTRDLLSNLLRVNLEGPSKVSGTVASADTVAVQFFRSASADTVTVDLVAMPGLSLEDLAAQWASDLGPALSVSSLDVRTQPAETELESFGTVRDPAAASEFYIAFATNQPLRLLNRVKTGVVNIEPASVRPNDLPMHALGALAQIVNDRLDITVDVVVAENGAFYSDDPTATPDPIKKNPDLFGKGLSDGASSAGVYPVVNTLFLIEDAADARDDLPLVAGHEVGHVLHLGHINSDEENLMYPSTLGGNDIERPSEPVPAELGSVKRITFQQHLLIRRRDGTPFQILQ